MKLIAQFSNKYNNITYKTYELDNGIKLLHLDNPVTVDFDFALVFKAGSSFEIKEEVPKGTAHFLEHMLLNPNSTFKTKEDIDRFEQGNKERPAIYTNAYTTRKNIYITGHSNEQGDMRVLDRMESILQFPKKKFSNQMEKERGIILAEKSRKSKKEKDSYLMSLEFLFKDIQDEFTYDILGESDDIKSIDIDHLEKFFKERFVTGNCAFTIQSNGELRKSVVNRLEEISKKVENGDMDGLREVNLENKLSIGTFTEERANGLSVSFIYFDKEERKIDYKRYAIEYIYGRLLDWLSYDILREKMSLVYDFSVFRIGNLSFDYSMSGFRFVAEKEKTPKMLEELYTVLHTTSFLFLKSKRGKEWFDDVISTYIFPRTTKFNEELAENAVTALLEESEIFNSNIAVREAKKITIEDVKEYLKERLELPPHIWVESDLKQEEMENIIKGSPFYKKFNKV
ncbi:insulinase family protein [Candidatus Dojkabacteria bacterium]|nr:insulinase family protein [Candidatus Dojkabacteria bacterium]